MNKINNTLNSLFKKGTGRRSNGLFKKEGLNLRDVIYNSYHPESKLGSYMRDTELSGKRQQVYIDKENKQLLFSVAGTRSGTDVFNDLRLASGGLKNTNRFKSADQTLKSAKELYPDYATTIVGSSLGGSIASRLGGAGDRRITYNAGEVGGKRRGGTTKVRHSGDVVSLLGAGDSFDFGNPLTVLSPTNWLSSHSSDRLKNENIYI